MGDQGWDVFARNLAGVLCRCPIGTALILASGNRFLDFSKGERTAGHDLSVHVCDDIGDSGRTYLRDRGWSAPGPDDLVWGRELREPGPEDYRWIALEVVAVLREVFGVDSPADLALDGWVECNEWQVPFEQLLGTAVDDGAPDRLVTIAEALLGDHLWLVDTLRYMLRDPATDRGFGAWSRLLDCLGDCDNGGIGAFAQFHWKQEADVIRDRLRRSIFHPQGLSWEWFPEFAAAAADWHPGDATEALLNRVGEQCGPLGFTLVSFVTEGDDYAITFIPSDRVDSLNELTAAAGQRVHAIP
ncbi:hypothetical protein ACFVUS_26635 [Nocardia sp. NPDC058058]|uniref:DUF6630 family protein n=1 Tax=Nocardia sp. NPDC058058 TaxID=3346317 RepID=UPI0036DD58EF